MAEARITEFYGETQIRVQVLDFMGLGSCMPREAWRLPSPQTLQNVYVNPLERAYVAIVHRRWLNKTFYMSTKG